MQEKTKIFVSGTYRRIARATSRPLPSEKRRSSKQASGRFVVTAVMLSLAVVAMASTG